MKQITKDQAINIRNQFGDAFYILDSNQFKKNYLELTNSFKKIYSNFNIAYSYKTNYIPKLCKIVNELNGYAEVVSEMELELALKVGASYKKIIWNGPIKNLQVLKEFLLNGGTVNVDNYDEFKYVLNLANENHNRIFNIGVRCNFNVGDGVISRFGIDTKSDEFIKIINLCKQTSNIKLINLQCHFAKRNLEFWIKRVDGMLDLIDRIDYIPDRIDLGGGLFGKMDNDLIKQFPFEIPSYEDYAKEIATKFNNKFSKLNIKPELIIEPGTALVGDCMSFAGTIKNIKKINNKYFATILGSQKNINMGGVNPPIHIINVESDSINYKNIDITGYTCIEGDVIYKNYSGKLAINDIVIINNCGSYSIVMKPPFILPNFPIIEVINEKIEIIKKVETFENIFNTYVF